jgi:hypothetical protein
MARGGGKSFRYVRRPQDPRITSEKLAKAVGDEIKKTVGKQHVTERERIVAPYYNKPRFGVRSNITLKEIRLEIYLKNPRTRLKPKPGSRYRPTWTIEDLWTALDKTGTPPHTIRPKKEGGVLRYPVGGQPKGRHGSLQTGPGRVGNEFRSSAEVDHPGTRPYKYTEKISRKLSKPLEEAISRGYEKGFRRQKKG